MKIIFSEEANSDLLQIHSYLAARNRPAAVALAKVFDAKLENLTHFPFIGRDRSSLSHGVRSVVAEN